ncbi:MAG: AfsR/SARP family transcriptional regulator [Gaiellaceae bacterium]
MIGGTRIARRLEATLAVTALLLVLALSWELRPALPQLPRSFSAPLPSGTITTTLELAAWIVFVLLDLVLIRKMLQFAIRRPPTHTELRLHRAFAQHERSPIDGLRDWRAHAAPLAPPVLRLPSRSAEPMAVRPQQVVPLDPSASTKRAATDADGSRLGVRVLGSLELIGCRKKQPRRQATAELIAYLALQPRWARRDELLEALWPGDDPRRTSGRFYQAVSEARKLLGDGFVRERDTYTLDREQVWIDVDELHRLRAEADAANPEHQQALLEDALALFRGQPLAGIEALWADNEMRRFCAVQVELLERLSRVRLEAGETIAALEAAELAHVLDPSNERPVQVAMEAEATLGRREAVVERYERLCRRLDEQFGLEPSRDTRHLYRRLLSQDVREPAPVASQRQ